MSPLLTVASVAKPTVGAIVLPNVLMHQNNAMAAAATVRAPTLPRPGPATLFLHIKKLYNSPHRAGDALILLAFLLPETETWGEGGILTNAPRPIRPPDQVLAELRSVGRLQSRAPLRRAVSCPSLKWSGARLQVQLSKPPQ